jgi:GxxExxY protein
MMPNRDPSTFAIIGAAMAVHRTLGHGFLEAVYQEALEHEFMACAIPYERECPLPIRYRGHLLRTSYRVDFLCYNTILVELKALQKLSGTEEAQVINYLKASGLEKALLINFGASSLEYRRLIHSLRKSVQSADETEENPQITQMGADSQESNQP